MLRPSIARALGPATLRASRAAAAAREAAPPARSRATGGEASTSSAPSRAVSTTPPSRRAIPDDGRTLASFMRDSRSGELGSATVAAGAGVALGAPTPLGTVFMETYGCQMNGADSEVVLSILREAGYGQAEGPEGASVILLNTCAIRDNAEATVWQRLGFYRNLKLGKHDDRRPRGSEGAGEGAAPTAPPPEAEVGPWGATDAPGGLPALRRSKRRQKKERPVVGVLGCMAERLKTRLLESDKLVDIVAGPDAYRDLPRLIDIIRGGAASSGAVEVAPDGAAAAPRRAAGARRRQTAINVQLSQDETYADVTPLRRPDAISAYLSIMRGCNNMCTFCIVPYVRGRERSRPIATILDEIRKLSLSGVKEVTLLGQNVNSYADFSESGGDEAMREAGREASLRLREARRSAGEGGASAVGGEADEDGSRQGGLASPFEPYAPGFASVYAPVRAGAVPFAELLSRVAAVDPEMRIRFTSPHPKDFGDDVLRVVAANPNVCSQLHVPAQSGDSRVLEAMRRGYTREAYDSLVERARAIVPGVALSTDIIAGFCGEDEAAHEATVSLMRQHAFEQAFMFAYSDRERTYAARNLTDDVPEATKGRRLQEIIAVYREGLDARSVAEVGRVHLVLVEGEARKKRGGNGAPLLTGRTDTFRRVVFADEPVPDDLACGLASLRADPTSELPALLGEGPRDGLWRAPGAASLASGDYAAVLVTAAGSTLRGRALARTTLQGFARAHGGVCFAEATDSTRDAARRIVAADAAAAEAAAVADGPRQAVA